MKRNIFLVMIITVFVKVIGFAREIVLTFYYGASNVSDVYIVSQTIPNTIFAIIGAGLVTTFIPIYSKVINKKGENEANKFLSSVINVVILISLIIAIFVNIFAKQVVLLFAPGFSGDTLRLAIVFTKISVFGIVITGVVYILNAYLQVKDNFIIPAFISLPMNFVIIFSFMISSKYGIELLAYGILISVLMQLIFIIPAVYKNRLKYMIVFDFKSQYIKEMLILSIPIIVGTSVNQLNVLVDKNIASTITQGGISALNYSYRLNGLINGLFVAPIVTVIYPKITRKVIDKDHSGLNSIINETIIYVALFVIPATIGSMVLARPIVEFLFMRGEFTDIAANMTSNALFYYSIGMLFVGLREVFSRVYYSYNDTRTPTINSVIGVVLNIILNVVLSRFMGISGLALATSISAIVTSLLLIFNTKKLVTNFGFKLMVTKLIKITGASLIMGLCSYIFINFMFNHYSKNLSLMMTIILSSLLYMVLIFKSNIPEVHSAYIIAKNKLKFR